VRVAAARGTAFRCYARVDVAFAGGLVGVVGPNGAGKTSLIEMIHFGCAGYSPRTSTESQVIRFGSDVTRVEVDAHLRSGPVTSEVGFRPGEPKRVTVAGAPERSVAALKPLGARLLKGFAEPVEVFEVDWRADEAASRPPMASSRTL